MGTVNTLGIGTMGFGGNVSLIGCKIGVLNRLPASFFVSVAYDCWAFRRLGVRLDARDGSITQWLYRDPSNPVIPMIDQEGFARTGREVPLDAPLDEATVRSLKVGDVVLVSGRMYTGPRCRACAFDEARAASRSQGRRPLSLRARRQEGRRPMDGHRGRSDDEHPRGAVSGGILRRYGVRAVVGKGGMGAKTLQGLKESGAVYLNAVGGAAQFYARCIERTDGVSLHGVRHARGDVAPVGPRFSRHRHDGCPRQQPAQGSRSRVGRRSLRRLSMSPLKRLDAVEIVELRPPVSALHRALDRDPCGEIFDRQQRKWRRRRTSITFV